MSSATTYSGHAEKILPGGETLVRMGKATALVANAVPGDALTLRLTGKRRGVMRAEIVEIVQPSAQRVQAPCPVAHACGGCALQHITAADQATIKSSWVSDAFKALMREQIHWMPIQSNDNRFRRRLRWFVGHDEQGDFLGFYTPASNQAVRHGDCMAVTPELNALRHLIEAHIKLETITSIQALQLSDGIHIILEAKLQPNNTNISHCSDFPLQWWWRDQQHITRPFHKPVRLLHDTLPTAGVDITPAVGPDDFVQGQAAGNRELISQIQAWAGPTHRIADLFCGIGNLSLPLAAVTGAQIYGAELNAASVRAASKNAKSLGLHATFVVANLFDAFNPEPYIGADVLILDPPRRGAKHICQQISRLLPKKIIMVSCDAAAGARDGALLKQHGYQLAALRALDMFPGAGHVETISLWLPE